MFEQSYTEYQTKKASLSALRANRTNSGYMIHSVRIFDQVLLKDFVDDLSQQAKYLFLTTLTKDYYIRFDPLLPTFGAVMPT